jgi:Bacterial capsule synthesis protein PGA_cap
MKFLQPALFVIVLAFNQYCGSIKTIIGENVEDNKNENTASTQGIPLPYVNESDIAGNLPIQPLNFKETELIDVRGVGDSAWSNTHDNTPPEKGYAEALKAFDPNTVKLKGDLSFVNLETTLGDMCSNFWAPHVPGSAYAFTSHPNTIRDAFRHGFNLFGLSNNHSRDCHNNSSDGQDGIQNTISSFEKMQLNLGTKNFLWHGVAKIESQKVYPAIKTFQIKGRNLTVAFASIYTGRDICPLSVCNSNSQAILKNLSTAKADLRILSIHSQGSNSQDALVKMGTEFIQKHNGDVVFGHGPHAWAPVRVLPKADGRRGVIFESLGNFLHPGLAPQSNNIMGRALFDSKTLELRQIQILPLRNEGSSVLASAANVKNIGANLSWKTNPNQNGLLYTNVKHGKLVSWK